MVESTPEKQKKANDFRRRILKINKQQILPAPVEDDKPVPFESFDAQARRMPVVIHHPPPVKQTKQQDPDFADRLKSIVQDQQHC
jgi:hypothetical protein